MLVKDFELETRTCTWVSAMLWGKILWYNTACNSTASIVFMRFYLLVSLSLTSPVLEELSYHSWKAWAPSRCQWWTSYPFFPSVFLPPHLIHTNKKVFINHWNVLFGWQEFKTEIWTCCLCLQAGKQIQSCVSHAAIGWLCLAIPTKEMPLSNNYREKYKTKGNYIKHCNY